MGIIGCSLHGAFSTAGLRGKMILKQVKKSWYVMLISGILSLVTFFNASCRPRVTVEKINQLITSEAPRGSNMSQVIAFLNSHQIEHSVYSDRPENVSDFRTRIPDEKKKIVKGYIPAIIRNVGTSGWDPFTTWNIQMHFYFDEKGTLVEYTVRESGTGF